MIKSLTQYSYFGKKPNKKMGRLQNSPSIRWLHPKSTHAHPLAWGNKKNWGGTFTAPYLENLFLLTNHLQV
jgi:hypothetical protein